MRRTLRNRIRVRRLFPLTWAATAPFFEPEHQRPSVGPAVVFATILAGSAMTLDLVTLPLRLPLLLIVPHVLPRKGER